MAVRRGNREPCQKGAEQPCNRSNPGWAAQAHHFNDTTISILLLLVFPALYQLQLDRRFAAVSMELERCIWSG